MKEKIGNAQAVLLVVSTILPTALVVLPAFVAKYLEQDTPLAIAVSGLLGFLVAWIIGRLIRLSNGEPFLDWVRERISPAAALISGILLLQYYFDILSSMMRVYTNFIKDNVLLDTPDAVIMVVITVVMLYMAGTGIVSISRINVTAHLLFLAIFPFYMGSLVRHMSITRVLPLFDHSAAALALGSLTPTGWMSEVSVLLFVAPYLKHPKQATRIGILGLLMVSGILFVDTLATILVLGPQFIKGVTYPVFSKVGIIEIGQYIENVDVLFISFWIMFMYIKIAIFTFVTVRCFNQTFRIQRDKPFTVALSLVALTECLYTWNNPGKFGQHNEQASIIGFLLANVLLPLGILLWVRLAGNIGKRKEVKT